MADFSIGMEEVYHAILLKTREMRFFKKSLLFFWQKQETILSAAFVVMSMIFLSRILGLVRYRLLAYFFGNKLGLLDNFIAASLVPEVIFDILIFGTISIAFIPVFSHFLAEKKEEEAWKLVTALIIIGVFIFILISLVVFILAEPLVFLIAPGQASRDHESQIMIANLIRIMLISQIFFIPGTILTGVFQTYRYFFIPALAPVFYNLGIILGIVFLSGPFSIYGPAYGMILGALLFLLAQLPLAKKLGVKLVFKDLSLRGVAQVLSLSLPRTAALIASRINDLINVALASLVSVGAIVVFNFAQTLQLAPVGIFGASMAQAILPTLSLAYSKKDFGLFKKIFLSTFHQVLFIIFPISAILAVLRIPIVRLVYGSSNFPWEATVMTGRVLIFFSFGLFAQVANLLFSRAFYAMHDTKTPLFITLGSIAINVSLSLFFVMSRGFPVQYLALSFSLANIFQGAFLFLFLAKKLNGFNFLEVFLPTLKIIIASLLMAVALYIPMKLLDQLVFDTTRTVPLILLTTVAGSSGLLVYAFFAWLFKIGQITSVYNLLRRFGKIRKVSEEIEVVVNGSTRLNS